MKKLLSILLISIMLYCTIIPAVAENGQDMQTAYQSNEILEIVSTNLLTGEVTYSTFTCESDVSHYTASATSEGSIYTEYTQPWIPQYEQISASETVSPCTIFGEDNRQKNHKYRSYALFRYMLYRSNISG